MRPEFCLKQLFLVRVIYLFIAVTFPDIGKLDLINAMKNLKKSQQNAPRLSEHPPVRGGKMSVVVFAAYVPTPKRFDIFPPFGGRITQNVFDALRFFFQ